MNIYKINKKINKIEDKFEFIATNTKLDMVYIVDKEVIYYF